MTWRCLLGHDWRGMHGLRVDGCMVWARYCTRCRKISGMVLWPWPKPPPPLGSEGMPQSEFRWAVAELAEEMDMHEHHMWCDYYAGNFHGKLIEDELESLLFRRFGVNQPKSVYEVMR